MIKLLSVIWVSDSHFPMSNIIDSSSLLLFTFMEDSIYAKNPVMSRVFYSIKVFKKRI